MRKLLFLTIFTNLIALGSEQDQVMLSNKDTAQLLANFTKLPEEIKCMVFPEYYPELNALVSLKKIPDGKNVNSGSNWGYYWEYLLHNDASWLPTDGYNSCVTNYILKDKKYPLFIREIHLRGCQPGSPDKRVLGPNKNKIILLDNYLFDLKTTNYFSKELIDDVYKKYSKKLYQKFAPLKEQQPRELDRISPQALLLDNKFLLDQVSLCLHPTRDVFITKDVSGYHVKAKYLNGYFEPINHKPRINISRFDSVSKKFTIISVNTPRELTSCVFDKSELSAETFWGIDTSNKLLRLTKNKDIYDFEEFNLEHPVVTIHQMRTDPTIVLINSDCKSYLYKIQTDRTLRFIREFPVKATFLQKDDNLSARTKYQQEHVVIIKPLTAVTEFIEKQSAKALVDKLPKLLAAKANLKQRILQSFQPGKDIK